MLKIRLARGGAKKRPYYSIVVADSHSPRDGRFIEKVGAYNPLLKKDDPNRVTLKVERIQEWIGKGAQPTDRVARFLSQQGLAKWEAGNNPNKGKPGKKAEERAAELYRRWCGRATIDALLMLHVSNGGTCATFGAYLDRVRQTISGLDCTRENYRATAWAKFQRLVRRFAPFLKGRLQSWDDGHGGAIRKEREGAERRAMQGDLFGWEGVQ